MIGTGQEFDECYALASSNPNVTWHSWVEAGELPAVIASHDVCLGIFGTTAKAQRVVPNKVYQGAAAGCRVVTSDTRPQRRAFGDSVTYVPAGNATALVDELVDLARDRDNLRRAQIASRDYFEREFSPQSMVVSLLAACERSVRR
jgi:glycosyltransferase involved in cell wall biosynthesis